MRVGIPKCYPEPLRGSLNYPCLSSCIDQAAMQTQNNHDVFMWTILYHSQFSHTLSHLNLIQPCAFGITEIINSVYNNNTKAVKNYWLTQWIYRRARTKSWDRSHVLDTAFLINSHLLRDVLSYPQFTPQRTVAQGHLKIEQCLSHSDYSIKSGMDKWTWPSRHSWEEAEGRRGPRPVLTPKPVLLAACMVANAGGG